MRKALTYHTIKQNSQKTVRKILTKQSDRFKENIAQGTNVANNKPELTEKNVQEINPKNNQTELKENNAQTSNVGNFLTQLAENSAQGTSVTI